jgi:hypothetical protein
VLSQKMLRRVKTCSVSAATMAEPLSKFCAPSRYVANMKILPRMPGGTSEVRQIIFRGLSAISAVPHHLARLNERGRWPESSNRRLAGLQRFLFHTEVDLRIAVGRFQADMSQPSADDVARALHIPAVRTQRRKRCATPADFGPFLSCGNGPGDNTHSREHRRVNFRERYQPRACQRPQCRQRCQRMRR